MNLLINDNNPHLVLITESWCNKDLTTAMLNIDGYYIDDALRKDKNSNNLARGIGGGLLVYVRNDVIVEPIDDHIDFTQYCRFKVYDKKRKNPLNFTLFYRSPNSSYENNIELTKVLEGCPKNSFFIGEANYP